MATQSSFPQGVWLTILTHAPAQAVKDLAEQALASLPDVTVIQNRTGLVMQPYTDSAQATNFHLGEVLVSEAHIKLPSDVQGYGMVMGRDTVFAMAVAVLDAALQSGIMMDEIAAFLKDQQQAQKERDELLLRKVASTYVEMETF